MALDQEVVDVAADPDAAARPVQVVGDEPVARPNVGVVDLTDSATGSPMQVRKRDGSLEAVDLNKILDRGAFDLDRVLELDPSFLDADEHDHDHVCGPDCDHDHHHHDHDHDHDHDHHGHETHHDTEITSVSLRGGELNPDKILTWISEVTQTQGPDILRLKGILAFPNEPKRYVVQGIHMIVEGDLQRDWKPGEPRESRLVFIGRHLDQAKLEAAFKAAAI